MLLRFEPIYQVRVWGGRALQERFGRPLPGSDPIGESWELVDRPEAQSVCLSEPWRGRPLHELWSAHRTEIFGTAAPAADRCPWLIKLLDAQDKLSLQVHPPAAKAAELGGEPKTEMWFILDATPSASLYAGLKKGVTRSLFESKLREGGVADCFHVIPVQKGDCLFLPSSRVHAIGAGLLIAEIQQNSDTTYRVYDWDRLGLDGKPRDLHMEEAMRSIDFEDFEPALASPSAEPMVHCDYFDTWHHQLDAETSLPGDIRTARLLIACDHPLLVDGERLLPGQVALAPASPSPLRLKPEGPSATCLSVTWPLSANP